MSFPIITSEKQKLYSNTTACFLEESRDEYIPMLCGIHGKACRQMGKLEGANRVLCSACSLASYCKTLTVKDIPTPINKYEIYTIDRIGVMHTLYEGKELPEVYLNEFVQHFNINGNGTTQIRI